MSRRKEPSPEELRTATEHAEEARRAMLEGKTLSEAAKALHVPSAALERALAGSPNATAGGAVGGSPAAGASPESDAEERLRLLREIERGRSWDSSSSAWDADHPRTKVDGGAGWEERPSGLGRELMRQLYNLGAKTGLPEYIHSRWAMGPASDFNRLEQIVSDTGAPPHIAKSARRWLEEYVAGVGTTPTDSDGDAEPRNPLRAALAQRQQDLANRLLEAQALAAIKQLERGGDGSTSPEVDRRVAALEAALASEKGRVAELERQRVEEQREARLLAAFDARLDPITHRLRTVEERAGARLTLSDVQVREANDAATLKSSATGRAIAELGERVHDAPRIGQKLERLVDVAVDSPGLRGRIQRALSDHEEREGIGVGPSDEEVAVAAELLAQETAESEVRDGQQPEPGRRRFSIPYVPPAESGDRIAVR